MAGGAGDSEDAITGINVTPLVDITLVLLIIFMVTAKLIVSKSVPLDLPKAASGSTLSWVTIRYGMDTAVNRPPRVPAVHSTQSSSTARRRPMRSLPIRMAPDPTVSNAMGAAP